MTDSPDREEQKALTPVEGSDQLPLPAPSSSPRQVSPSLGQDESLPQPSPSLRQDESRVPRHLKTAGKALLNWWRAASIQALCDAALWLIGLLLLHVPLAPAWALIAGLMAFVPNIGGVIALIGPTLSILFSGKDLERLAFLLGLYACIVVIDQLVLQPWLMKRAARVPVWASILVPIVLGIVIPFWGVLLAPPLLAIVYAFRKPKQRVS
jgi:predicted PurR-regulated permease PerM